MFKLRILFFLSVFIALSFYLFNSIDDKTIFTHLVVPGDFKNIIPEGIYVGERNVICEICVFQMNLAYENNAMKFGAAMVGPDKLKANQEIKYAEPVAAIDSLQTMCDLQAYKNIKDQECENRRMYEI